MTCFSEGEFFSWCVTFAFDSCVCLSPCSRRPTFFRIGGFPTGELVLSGLAARCCESNTEPHFLSVGERWGLLSLLFESSLSFPKGKCKFLLVESDPHTVSTHG